MSDAPIYNLDVSAFKRDPYPDLSVMREVSPICFVPELDATLFTKRADIFVNEKRIDVFSSLQPDGLMTRLMGENMMRKDGLEHQRERRIIAPSVSPKSVKNVWLSYFNDYADALLDELESKGSGDLIKLYAMPLSAEALKLITGLTNMHFKEMDRVSQGMIDGCANYTGDKIIEDNCNNCTASIDSHIDEMLPILKNKPNLSLLSVQANAKLSDAQIRANVKLAISGGQNESRDAIAGSIWALLTHPEQLAQLNAGKLNWLQVFEEYVRWISPIGMSPRQVAKKYSYKNIQFDAGERIFFMFGSANRDSEVFDEPDVFDIDRKNNLSIPFGAGPHYCAGAWVSRALIADVALPKLFTRLKNLSLFPAHTYDFNGWAFRGLTSLECQWDKA